MANRRKKGNGTVTLRKDGRWEGRYIVGYDEEGKAIRKSVFGKTKTECTEKLRNLKDESSVVLGRSPTAAKTDMKFGEWLDIWFNSYCAPGLRESTMEGYRLLIYRHIIPEIGEIPINRLTQADLQRFYTQLKSSGRLRNTDTLGIGLSDRTVRACHQKCIAALDKAVEQKLISRNPAVGCKLPPKKSAKIKVLNHEEIYRFLQQAKYEGYYELMLLELATGLRRGEILGLQWNDLDEETGELRVERQVTRVNGKLTVVSPKTKHSVRTIMLPMPIVNVLLNCKKNINSKWMFPSPVKEEDEPRDPQSLYHRTQLILQHAGCKKIRFHDLRHTFATISLENGMDVKTLSAIIGHISSATTLDIYSHITNEMQVSAAKKIDQGYGRKYETSGEVEEPKAQQNPVRKPYDPYKGKIRRSGTGGIYQINDHLYEGRYSPTNAEGKREWHNVYAKTYEECEKKLREKIEEIKNRIQKDSSLESLEDP